MVKAQIAPSELSRKSLRELTRPGMNRCKNSAVADSEIQINKEMFSPLSPRIAKRKINTGTNRKKFATGSIGPL
jgi:hypothetical protein